ncbi:MAG: hypothetical protein U1E62_02360 [Alsobacter sp.]
MASRALFLAFSALVILTAHARLPAVAPPAVISWFLGCGIMVVATHGCYHKLLHTRPTGALAPQDQDRALIHDGPGSRRHVAALALFPLLFLAGNLVTLYGPWLLR